MKPHIKVMQRNGVDIFVTSSMVMNESRIECKSNALLLANLDKERIMRYMRGEDNCFSERSTCAHSHQGPYEIKSPN